MARPTMKVVIIGAGIGGLVCAIACRRENLEVVVLERAPALAPIGAGIQLPPNAARVARQLGLLPELVQRSVVLDSIEYLRYADGSLLYKLEGGHEMEKNFGEQWMVISRPEYHSVLWSAAEEAGADLRLGCEMQAIDPDRPIVHLVGGQRIEGDVIVGADGLWSLSRNYLLGKDAQPQETGDLAYRATVSSEKLRALHDPAIDHLTEKSSATVWMGPEKHCVLYPLDGGKQLNLVLIRPDNLEKNVRTDVGDLNEMKASFEGWDERLTRIISCIPSVLKWKLCHHDELETWTKHNVALLGDACHPTLPYQAQGAAMAAEDGAVLGNLLGRLSKSKLYGSQDATLIPSVLKLYESLRKRRTTLNVRGAMSNQEVYHMPDGPLQRARDAWLLSSTQDQDTPELTFANWEYMRAMFEFDPVAESSKAFSAWEETITQPAAGKL